MNKEKKAYNMKQDQLVKKFLNGDRVLIAFILSHKREEKVSEKKGRSWVETVKVLIGDESVEGSYWYPPGAVVVPLEFARMEKVVVEFSSIGKSDFGMRMRMTGPVQKFE